MACFRKRSESVAGGAHHQTMPGIRQMRIRTKPRKQACGSHLPVTQEEEKVRECQTLSVPVSHGFLPILHVKAVEGGCGGGRLDILNDVCMGKPSAVGGLAETAGLKQSPPPRSALILSRLLRGLKRGGDRPPMPDSNGVLRKHDVACLRNTVSARCRAQEGAQSEAEWPHWKLHVTTQKMACGAGGNVRAGRPPPGSTGLTIRVS